jgi:hypothetical protein
MSRLPDAHREVVLEVALRVTEHVVRLPLAQGLGTGLTEEELRQDGGGEHRLGRGGAAQAAHEHDGVRLDDAKDVRVQYRLLHLGEERVELAARDGVERLRVVEVIAEGKQRLERRAGVDRDLEADRDGAVVEEARAHAGAAGRERRRKIERGVPQVHVERRRREEEPLTLLARPLRAIAPAPLEKEPGRDVEVDLVAHVEDAVREDAAVLDGQRRLAACERAVARRLVAVRRSAPRRRDLVHASTRPRRTDAAGPTRRRCPPAPRPRRW